MARNLFHWSQSAHAGAEHRFGPEWSLHAGISDESRDQGTGKRHPSAGLDYRPSANWNVEFGYVRPYSDGLRGLQPVAPGGSLTGRVGTMHQLIGVFGRLKF